MFNIIILWVTCQIIFVVISTKRGVKLSGLQKLMGLVLGPFGIIVAFLLKPSNESDSGS